MSRVRNRAVAEIPNYALYEHVGFEYRRLLIQIIRKMLIEKIVVFFESFRDMGGLCWISGHLNGPQYGPQDGRPESQILWDH